MVKEPSDELSLLLVEDNPGDARLFKHHLNTERTDVFPSPDVTHVEALAAGFETLEDGEFDMVLLDLGLPESSGLDTLERYNETVEGTDDIDSVPVIVLTGLKDDETSLEAIEQGAQDYLVKDNLNINVLNRTIRHALERYRQEQQLRQQNQRLEKFASVVSHDLRNPLALAISHTEIAEQQCAEGNSAEEAFSDLQEVHQRMDALIDDLLTMTRTDRTIENIEPVTLSGVVEESWAAATTEGVTFESDVPWETTIEADPDRLQRVCENLIRNAVEHNDPPLTVRVGLLEGTDETEDSSTVGFYVEDDGRGIPAEERDEVFSHGYSTSDGGTGYGLSIVADIADAHGWNVTLCESEDGGARFEIRTDSPTDSSAA